MTASRGGLNWSAQHSSLLTKMECGHETTTSHLLLGGPAVRDLGSLAGWRADEFDRTPVWVEKQLYCNACRAPFALRDAGQGCEQGYRSVVSALIKQSQRLPGELYRSLTWDRGKELADHQRLTLATEVDVYFCDPRSPWQRGSNESTNRLLRQYLPRGTDLSQHSQAKLSAIARQLNERPRKTLLYQTPAEKFAECVAAIG